MKKPELPSELEGTHIHFVGIKGTGMAALVEILVARGAIVTGSDVSERFYTDEILEKLGITALPFSEKNVSADVDYVIYSSAYSPEKNPDLKEASARGVPMMLYTEALGSYSKTAFSSGICGVHGKTTTTGLTGTILRELDLSSQVLAGSIISSFGNSCTMTNLSEGRKNYFVAETCEYQRHFMAFAPRNIILTSVESDHQDYYPTYEDIRDAFVDYVEKLPDGGSCIYCADDAGACEVVSIAQKKRGDIKFIPYGEKAEGDWKITLGATDSGRQYFSVAAMGECAICVPGIHNVKNSTAAAALACQLLKDDGKEPSECFDRIKKGLLNFAGGKRRSEIVGRTTAFGNEVIFIDDYGHHPTAVKNTLEGFRKFYSCYKIVVDFMSHTYTRTAALLEEFASSFSSADMVVLNKIYGSAREDASASNVTGKTLADCAKKYHPNVVYAEEFDEAASVIMAELRKNPGDSYPKGYLVVTMGAGDNWKVGKKILEELK